MYIKITKGYDDDNWLVLKDALTEEHFEFRFGQPTAFESHNYVRAIIEAELKPEYFTLAKKLDLKFPKISSFPIDEKVETRGVRTKENRDKRKKDAAYMLAGKLTMERDTIVEDSLEKLNKLFQSSLDAKNKKYITNIKRVFGGDMDDSWMEKELDDPELNKEIEKVTDQLNQLEHKKKTLINDRRKLRNRNMENYMNENGWRGPDGNVLPEEVIKELKTMYKMTQGFFNYE